MISHYKVYKEANVKPKFGARINWASPAAQWLVGCWLINDGAGVALPDIAGARTGVLSGNVAHAPGGIQWAADTSGIIIPSAAIGLSTGSVVIRATLPWMVSDNTTPHSLFDSDGTRHAFYHSKTNIDFRMYNNGREQIFAPVWTIGKPHTFVFVYDKSTLLQSMYIDGIAVTKGSSGGGWGSTALGANAYAGKRYTGADALGVGAIMHEILTYNCVLSADEIVRGSAEPYGNGLYLVPTGARIFIPNITSGEDFSRSGNSYITNFINYSNRINDVLRIDNSQIADSVESSNRIISLNRTDESTIDATLSESSRVISLNRSDVSVVSDNSSDSSRVISLKRNDISDLPSLNSNSSRSNTLNRVTESNIPNYASFAHRFTTLMKTVTANSFIGNFISGSSRVSSLKREPNSDLPTLSSESSRSFSIIRLITSFIGAFKTFSHNILPKKYKSPVYSTLQDVNKSVTTLDNYIEAEIYEDE